MLGAGEASSSQAPLSPSSSPRSTLRLGSEKGRPPGCVGDASGDDGLGERLVSSRTIISPKVSVSSASSPHIRATGMWARVRRARTTQRWAVSDREDRKDDTCGNDSLRKPNDTIFGRWA